MWTSLRDEAQVGFAGGQHVLHPIRFAVGQPDGQHVALAVGGDDGFVLLAGCAATVLDHRERRKVARERLHRRVEVLDLEVLEPGREEHRDAQGRCWDGPLRTWRLRLSVVCRHCTGPICGFSGTVTSLPAQRHQIFLTRLAHDGPARPAVCFVRHVRRHGPYVHMRGKTNSACVTLFSAAAYPHDSQPSEVCRGSTSIHVRPASSALARRIETN